MTSYRVVWEIDVTAESAIEAAQAALDIQRDPNSTATVFSVFTEKAGPEQIDLFEFGDDEPDEQLERSLH